MSELTPEELALLAQETDGADVAEPRRARRRRQADAPAPAVAPAAPAEVAPVLAEVAPPVPVKVAPPAPARGPHTPVQFHDDGWRGLPVQMRG